MVKRTPHGESRSREEERPTGEAARDKATAHEIYRDIESDYFVFVGARGRTHIFNRNGEHHTSFRTTGANRTRRIDEGKWERISRDQLPDEVK